MNVVFWEGNDGEEGSWFTDSPSNAISGISVASVDNIITPLQNATVHGIEHNPITYFNVTPLPVNGTLPIFATSNNTAIMNDACDPLPPSTPNLAPFVVIIRSGGCSFVGLLHLI